MEVKERRELEARVDKRHVISIGERLYAENVELIRELINNAYDAEPDGQSCSQGSFAENT